MRLGEVPLASGVEQVLEGHDGAVNALSRLAAGRLASGSDDPPGGRPRQEECVSASCFEAIVFWLARTPIFPEQTLATARARPWACLGPGVSPELVQTAFGNVYKQKSKCEWPGDARHAARRFS